jgi:hypothetical protein
MIHFSILMDPCTRFRSGCSVFMSHSQWSRKLVFDWERCYWDQKYVDFKSLERQVANKRFCSWSRAKVQQLLCERNELLKFLPEDQATAVSSTLRGSFPLGYSERSRYCVICFQMGMIWMGNELKRDYFPAVVILRGLANNLTPAAAPKKLERLLRRFSLAVGCCDPSRNPEVLGSASDWNERKSGALGWTLCHLRQLGLLAAEG